MMVMSEHSHTSAEDRGKDGSNYEEEDGHGCSSVEM